MTAAMAGPGLVLESATEHVEVAVAIHGLEFAAHLREDVGHGHTRRLAVLAGGALAQAGVAAGDLRWIAADLGPGSFTGVRVGLATASALALAAGARVLGASSLAALAHAAGARRALVIPLVQAGRRDLYAGFFRADTRGKVTLLAAPRVGDLDSVFAAVDEVSALAPGAVIRFIGPGAARERERLEGAFEGSTFPAWRHEGLSAEDLARAATAGLGPAAGLPAAEGMMEPLYVRPAQAEESVRRRVSGLVPLSIRPFLPDDIPLATTLENLVFSDPWPESFFRSEIGQALAYARVAERGVAEPGRPESTFAGYLLAWLGDEEAHLGNLAVAPAHRRSGVARALVEDLLSAVRARGSRTVALEVRTGNSAAQALYRAHGFRLAGLRRGYYRDTGEDALIMMWRNDH
ncbi:MAG: tRNA (adenosine(37)-N6)-threonylcarbamoyltransferase complex dimerization subunit type 1 TsaB [Candidatus Eisenbacteria bacterium]